MRTLFAAAFFLVPVAACGLFPEIEPYGRCANGGCADASGVDGSTTDAKDDLPTPTDGGCIYGKPPSMVRTEWGCIDSTEVTRDQYQTFMSDVGAPKPESGVCAFNDTYAVSKGYIIDNTKPDDPMRGVDWCDARDYCAWAGKRLCGKVGGGALPFASSLANSQSQWYRVCSHGALSYPYGTKNDDKYKAGYCNTGRPDAGQHAQTPVGSLPNCTVPEAGVYDLIGNVQEWADTCESTADAGADRCQLFGGTWTFDEPPNSGYVTCGWGSSSTVRARNTLDDWSVGFRCCAN